MPGVLDYIKSLRKDLRGVEPYSKIAGIDKDMAILCLALFMSKFDKLEDPDEAIEVLQDQWTKGQVGVVTEDGRSPGAKEAAALPKMIEWLNDFFEIQED